MHEDSPTGDPVTETCLYIKSAPSGLGSAGFLSTKSCISSCEEQSCPGSPPLRAACEEESVASTQGHFLVML